MSTTTRGGAMRRVRNSAQVVLGVVMLLLAASVAVFVGRASDQAATPAVSGSGTQVVAIQLGDMRIMPPLLTVAAGTHVVLEVTNTDTVRHDLAIDGGPQTPLLGHQQTARLDLGVVSQSLQGWCTVPGHRAAGMTMRIEVTGSSAGPAPSMSMPMPSTSGTAPVIDFHAAPGPQWKPYDPTLVPAPGSTEHDVTLTVRDTSTEVAPGVRQTLWTYNGTAPGPVLRGHVGDIFTITLVNGADHAHGIDFHAGSVAPDGPMRSIDPGQSLVYQFQANYSGAWLYHCSTMPMSLHIANGMFAAVIIDPPGLAPVSQEFVLIQSELYLGKQDGTANEAAIAAGKPDAVVFNGYVNQYVDAPVQVRAGERIRVWVVDAGPQFGTSFHVVGTQFDTVFKEGAYLLRAGNAERGAAQTLDLAPAQGGFVEFVLPAAGNYSFIDHAMVDAERGARGIFTASG